MRATVHNLNGKWLAVPELTVDFFFGVLSPNNAYIKQHGLEFFNNKAPFNEFAERKIIVGRVVNVDRKTFEFLRFEEIEE